MRRWPDRFDELASAPRERLRMPRLDGRPHRAEQRRGPLGERRADREPHRRQLGRHQHVASRERDEPLGGVGQPAHADHLARFVEGETPGEHAALRDQRPVDLGQEHQRALDRVGDRLGREPLAQRRGRIGLRRAGGDELERERNARHAAGELGDRRALERIEAPLARRRERRDAIGQVPCHFTAARVVGAERRELQHVAAQRTRVGRPASHQRDDPQLGCGGEQRRGRAHQLGHQRIGPVDHQQRRPRRRGHAPRDAKAVAREQRGLAERGAGHALHRDVDVFGAAQIAPPNHVAAGAYERRIAPEQSGLADAGRTDDPAPSLRAREHRCERGELVVATDEGLGVGGRRDRKASERGSNERPTRGRRSRAARQHRVDVSAPRTFVSTLFALFF